MTNVSRRAFVFGGGLLLATTTFPIPAEAVPDISNENGFPYIPKMKYLDNPTEIPFDHVNDYLKGVMQRIADHYVHTMPENTLALRSSYSSYVNSVGQMLKNNRFIEDSLGVCDETNNTPVTIDTNGILVDLYIKHLRGRRILYSVGDEETMMLMNRGTTILI